MMCQLSVAMSRTDMTWPSAGQPEALTKWELVIPSFAACAFIIAAKLSSVPPMPSASVTAASFPESTKMPRMRSSMVMFVPTCTNMREPPMCQAWSLTRKVWSIRSLPALSCWKVM